MRISIASPAEAQQLSVDELMAESDPMGQVNSVNQLTDISPSDWAFQAVKNMVERYQCLEGYPDQTFRGNRPVTRFEFAAALNACLDRVLEIVGGEEGITPEDFATLRALVEEFEGELAVLRGRVDDLEARTAQLEANQFSTTTKLRGETIFTVADTFGDRIGTDNDDSQTIFGYRVRLNFDTSFTGKDRLRARLQARDIPNFNGSTGTDESRLGYDGDSDAVFELDDLHYRFPVGSNIRVYVAAQSFEFRDFGNTLAPFVSSGSGALSRFGRLNPIMRQSDDGVGLGVELNLGKFGVDLGYLAIEEAANPAEKNGLFNGAYGAFANAVYEFSDSFAFGVFYQHYFAPGGQVNVFGSTGTDFAQQPFGSNVATSSDSVGAQAEANLGSFVFGGWVGYTWADANDPVDNIDDLSAEALNWGVQLGLKDLAIEGSLLGIVVGQPPYTTDNDLAARDDSEVDGSTFHVEAFYRIPINDNLEITPGAFVIFNPESNSDNDEIVVGAIRATFEF
ncbi:MAG: iron uptake porin [Coleofasciculaceae cyanobacterium SM2_3_26]|nr:iron uptake porin [Coleofasciculaceae cyanobacterium SM2_3_26]